MRPIRNDRGEALRKGKLSDFSGAIIWLRDHGLAYSEIRSLFPEKSDNSLSVTDFRSRRSPDRKVARRVLEQTSRAIANSSAHPGASGEKTQPRANHVPDASLDHPAPSAKHLEDEVEEFASTFWKHVRYLEGIKRLGKFRQRVNDPGSDNVSLVRTGGRVNHLLSELHLHAGYSTSALAYGLDAYRWECHAFNARPTRWNLERIGRTSLLMSQASILRSDFFSAGQWLKCAEGAFERVGRTDPEMYRQQAVVGIHTGNTEGAADKFRLAGERLPEYNPLSTAAAVKDIRDRFLNYVNRDWEGAFALMEYASGAWPPGDIHIGINMNWAAAIAFMTDDPIGHDRAERLLNEHSSRTKGYGHPATVTYLLKLTTRLPRPLWREWARFSLNNNAYRNK